MAGADEAEQTPRAPDPVQPADQAEPKPERLAGQAEPTREQPGDRTEPTPEQPTDQAEQAAEPANETPGFGERGRMRRRARFLRKARELAYRDLGGLVFDLHRFGQRNDQLVLAKLAALRQIDTEVRELEEVLRDRRPITVLREVGIAACPRCAAIHGSDDLFCPGCGLAFDTSADRPISTAPVNARPHTSVPLAQPPAATVQAATPPAPAQPTATPQTTAPAPAAGTPAPATPAAATPAPSTPGPATPAAAPPAAVSTPPTKPTAAPVAAKPASPPTARERKPDRDEEDEPTQILRPPAPGA